MVHWLYDAPHQLPATRRYTFMPSPVTPAGHPKDVPQEASGRPGCGSHVVVVRDHDAKSQEEREEEDGAGPEVKQWPTFISPSLSRRPDTSVMSTSKSLRRLRAASTSRIIFQEVDDRFTGQIPPIDETQEPSFQIRRRTFEGKPYGERLWELVSLFGSAGCYAVTGTSILTFHELLVETKQWLSDREFNEVYAMSMALPGPNTTALAIIVGIYRAGVLGGLVALLSWCLPSLVAVIGLGMASAKLEGKGTPPWLSGVKAAAVALLFVTFFRLASKMVNSNVKKAVTVLSTCIALVLAEDKGLPFSCLMWALPLLLALGGLATLTEYRLKESRRHRDAGTVDGESTEHKTQAKPALSRVPTTNDTYSVVSVPWYVMYGCLVGVVAHLAIVAAGVLKGELANMYGKFFLTGISVYGGGNVLVPLLVHLVVTSGWISMDQFLQGYAVVNILPGPSFNLAGYLGAVYLGLPGALLAWIGLTLPSILLAYGLLPMWHKFRHVAGLRPFLSGMSCAGVGLILTAALGLAVNVMTTSADLVAAIVAATMVGAFHFQVYIGIIAAWAVGIMLSRLVLGWGQTQLVIPVT